MSTEENFLLELQKLLKKHQWSMAIPDKNAVDHLIIGKEEVLIKVTEKTGQAYDVMTPPEEQ